MSRRSSCAAGACRTFGCGRDNTCVPLKWFAIWISEFAAMISMSGLAQAASAPQAAGQIRPSSRELAPIAAGSTQRPRHRCYRAVESEFAEHGEAGECVGRNRADRAHEPERDRQIVV